MDAGRTLDVRDDLAVDLGANVDTRRVAGAMADFARTIRHHEGFVLEDILRELCRRTMAALDVDAAGVMIADGGLTRFVYASSEVAGEAELLQEALGSGPCTDALANASLVVETDLEHARERWPGFTERVVELGLRSVAGLPLTGGNEVLGILDLYRFSVGGFTADELRVATTLADLAASYLMLAAARDAARAAQEEYAYRALHDELTGLPNRSLLMDRLTHALNVARRHGTAVATVFIDLDGFKEINDAHGHGDGDAVLRTVAHRLRAVVRDGDTLARMGGDEFVLVCEDLPERQGMSVAERAAVIVERIRSTLAEPVSVGGDTTVVVGASTGTAVAHPTRQAGLTAEEQLRLADRAMYQAKRAVRAGLNLEVRPSGRRMR